MHETSSIDAITRFIFCKDAPRQVDLAIVLGSPSISNVEPAIALYHEGLTPRILITGHGPSGARQPEWRAYRDHAVTQGVLADDILIEPEATNTRENLIFSERIIARDLGWETITDIAICCKPLHTRRAFMTAREYLPKCIGLTLLPPRNEADIQPENWWTTARGIERVLGEVRRIAEYAQKGDISIE
ncbi:MAG: YdcF family protein [Roseovarius sp.]